MYSLSEKLFIVTPCGHVGGVEVQLHSFITSALDKDEQSTLRLSGFIHENEHRYPLNRRLGGSQSRPVNFGKKSLSPTGIRTPNRQGRSIVTILTELSRLHVKFVIKSLYYSLTPCRIVLLEKFLLILCLSFRAS